MDRIAKTILLVIGILAAIVAIFFFVFVFSVTSYKTHDNLSPETQKAYAKHALMPELEGRIERYGVACFQDPDCMIETFKYQSLDDLYVSMPKVKEHMATAEGTKGRDIKGKKVLLMDDVFGGGGTTKALRELARKAGAEVSAHAVVAVEQGSAHPDDLFYLFELPVL